MLRYFDHVSVIGVRTFKYFAACRVGRFIENRHHVFMLISDIITKRFDRPVRLPNIVVLTKRLPRMVREESARYMGNRKRKNRFYESKRV